jgi:hypothetical protein
MDGWMDEWMNGWINGWMDGWMNGWMDIIVINFFFLLGVYFILMK